MKRNSFMILALFLSSLSTVESSYASEGITQISLNSSIGRPGETITVNFEISAPQNADQNYGVNVTFSGLKLSQSFGAKAELFDGTHGQGKWRANIVIPTKVFSDNYLITFKGLGPGRSPKLEITSKIRPTINIVGESGPVYPQFEIFNITTDKSNYTPGERITINFQSKILSGALNSETDNPDVLVKDTKNNLIIRATPRTKPPIATGSYESGSWTATYLLPQDMLTTQAQVEIRYPGTNNTTYGVAKGTVFLIQSLKTEIKILDVKLNKATYLPNEPILVTFKTSSTGLISNDSNKPFLVLTDNEYSDLSSEIPATLVSGNINSGSWKAEINQSFKDGEYFFAFYNRESSIRETGPLLKIKSAVSISITCIKGKTTKKVSGTNPKCPKGYKEKK